MINTHELVIILVRSIITILILIIITKLLGKKQLSQLTLYDYIVGITVGSLSANSILFLEYHFLNGVSSIIIFGISAIIISTISFKSKKAYCILNGKPIVLMENGEFNFENLRKTKIPIYKFIEQSRLKGYFDLSIIDWAILETNGQISFLLKKEYQESIPKYFKNNIRNKLSKQSYNYYLIVDGVIQNDNLEYYGKDEAWLQKELKKAKINNFKSIALMEVDTNNKIKIFKELI